ncbi:MAG: formate dehydrogenase accessory protein FdhE [Acidobacteriota bacterium]
MVSRDFQALSEKRAARARFLAHRYPAARQVLDFCGDIAAFQQTIPTDSPLEARPLLVELVIEKGPELLKKAARELTVTACRKALKDYLREQDTTSPRSFFARVLLQGQMAKAAGIASSEVDRLRGAGHRCPRCGHPPQVGCLRPQGDGTALSLMCSLCLAEWPFERGRCPACGEADGRNMAYYSADELPHLKVQVCETCRRYLHSVNLSKDPEAVPDVDEVAALPLDVWALEQGFRKLHPNLVGI